MSFLKWSKWVSLHKIYVTKNAALTPPVKPGVYKIKCVKNGEDVLIQRANDIADEILYIGETKGTLKERISDFWKAANENSNDIKTTHSAGNTYVLFNFKLKFPLKCLKVKWAITNNSKAVEKKMLNKYKQKTFDLPPFNIKLERLW